MKGDIHSETNSNYNNNNYNIIQEKIKNNSSNRFELKELITYPNIPSKRKINEIAIILIITLMILKLIILVINIIITS